MTHSNKIFEDFLRYNAEQSARFTDPGQTLLRRQYRAKYDVEICATKCMDGRLNLSIVTGIPIGIIQPFRNLGGKFDVGGHFGELLIDFVGRAVARGKDCIALVTYHWSRGSKDRGCKGFHCDLQAAQAYTRNLMNDMEYLFGKDYGVVYPLQLGVETDEDALILHGANGKSLDLSKVEGLDETTLRIRLEELFPDMKRRMIESLIPLCLGNIEHVKQVRKANRPLSAIDHKENKFGFGRGFDSWFHLPNQMLIVGPYSYNLAEPIAVAGRILLDNIVSGRIPKEEGLAFISSAVFRDEAGPERARAVLKARSLAHYALDVLKHDVPEVIQYMDVGAGILNENTRLFTPIEVGLPNETELAMAA